MAYAGRIGFRRKEAMTNVKEFTANELKALPIGHSKMIRWECVTRWSENVYEVGTWGKLYSMTDFESTLTKLTHRLAA
jgi:hypothetical protein